MLWVVIRRFRSILSVSFFRGPMFVAIIVIDRGVNCKPQLGFSASNFKVCVLLKSEVMQILLLLLVSLVTTSLCKLGRVA